MFGQTSLTRERGPFISAQTTHVLPRLNSPWDPAGAVDGYLFEHTCFNLGGQLRVGTAYMLFEEGTPQLPSLTSSTAPGEDPPSSTASPAAAPVRPSSPMGPPPRRPTPMPLVIGGTAVADPRVTFPRSDSEDSPMGPQPPSYSPSESKPVNIALAVAINRLLKNLKIGGASPQNQQEVPEWTAYVEPEKVTQSDSYEGTPPTENTPMELEYPPSPEPEPTSEEPALQLTKGTLQLQEPEAHYNLRPRPEPRKTYYERPSMWTIAYLLTPPLIYPVLVPRNRKRRVRPSIKDTFDHPKLALQVTERTGLENILLVPARLWTKQERRFMRLVVKSLRRALTGKVGYGEVVPPYQKETSMGRESDTE